MVLVEFEPTIPQLLVINMVTVVEIAGVSAGISKYSMYLGHIHQYQPWKLCKNLVGGGWKLAIFVAGNKNLTKSVTSGNEIQIAEWLFTKKAELTVSRKNARKFKSPLTTKW